MGLFKKKADPVSERARTLNQQIAALEAEIVRLSEQELEKNQAAAKEAPQPAAAHEPSPPPPQPRLRSTALPHGHSGTTLLTQAQAAQPPPAPTPTEEPELEDVNPFRMQTEPATPEEHYDPLGVRKQETTPVWERIRNNFRAPPTANPKLVNYLAAGSIHGLRPLRYEKRVARNRFLLLVVALAIMLWGILAALL